METPNQDITGIANYAGTWSKALIAQLLNTLDIVNDLKVIYNVTAPLNLSKLTVNAGIRPLDTSVNTSFKPGRVWSKRTLTPRVGMKIFTVVPEELRDTWQSEMLSPNALDVPFADWVWAQEFAKLQEEINDTVGNMTYNGDANDYDATVIYTAGQVFVYGVNRYIYKVLATTVAGNTPDNTPAKFEDITLTSICDGPLTVLNQAIADNSIPAGQIIATGAITAANAVAALYSVWLGAPERLRNKNTIMWVSNDIYNAYKKNYNVLHPYFDYDKNAGTIYLDLTSDKCEIRPCTWLAGSGRVIMSLPDNWIMGTNLLSDTNGIGKMIPTVHGFIAICKFILCFQFADTELVYVNDQE
ncbi:hypothetical protein [Mucilaginibacter sp.]